MKSSSLPDGIPVLSPGRHRNPRKGACFMEYASVLAGEKWSDHPACTHPLLAALARLVNDHTSDAERQRLTPLIPTVVGRRGDSTTSITVAVAVAASVILDVPEATQRVLAAGLIQAEMQCESAGPALAATRHQAQGALELVPGAVAWADRIGKRERIDVRTFEKQCAPTMIRCAVQGIVATKRPDRDRRLHDLLQVGIAACPAAVSEPHGTVPDEVLRSALGETRSRR